MNKWSEERKKYTWGKYIGLPIQINDLPEYIKVEGEVLTLKSSFHVSLLHVEGIISKYGQDNKHLEKKINEAFLDFVSQNPISFLSYKNEIRYVVRNDRKSIVIMCEVSNIRELFDYLNEKFKMNVEVPPTHVTLYTLQKDLGIGLTTVADISSYTKMMTKDLYIIAQKLLSSDYRKK